MDSGQILLRFWWILHGFCSDYGGFSIGFVEVLMDSA